MHGGKMSFNSLILFIFLSFVSVNVNAGLFKSITKTSESVGYYWNGSLKNAKALKKTGKGYQVVRVSRKRYYGHQDLVDFIQDLGAQAEKKKFGVLLVGDMAQKKGGRIPGLHRSHQIGLDADIFFNLQKDYLPKTALESQGPRSVLGAGGRVDAKKWTPAHSEILKLASQDDRVERIFVNYSIKKHLCKIHGKEPWLSKIRPMGGHTGHFHVRLACPSNSASCKAQPKPQANPC